MSIDYQYTNAKKRITREEYNEYSYKFDVSNDNILKAIVKMSVYSASWRRASNKKINMEINRKVRNTSGNMVRKNTLYVTADLYDRVLEYVALGYKHWSDCIYCGEEAKNKHPTRFGQFVCDRCKEPEVEEDE